MNKNDSFKTFANSFQAVTVPGLSRISALCNKLGSPQRGLKFIHVAGTNGKGSTSAMLDSILREAGYRVGLFTSPYVREFNERMRVDGKNIPNDTLARLTERAKGVAEKMADCLLFSPFFPYDGCTFYNSAKLPLW